MAPGSRPEGHLNMKYTPTSQTSTASTGSDPPNDPSPAATVKPPFGASGGLSSAGNPLGGTRLGAGSPSHEIGGRFYSKRLVSNRNAPMNPIADLPPFVGPEKFRRRRAFLQASGVPRPMAIQRLSAKTFQSLPARTGSPILSLLQKILSIALPEGPEQAQFPHGFPQSGH
jgi:hypothetical protein